MIGRVRAVCAMTLVAGMLGGAGHVFAQGNASGVDCSKPLAAGPNDWMNTTFELGGAKTTNTITVTGDTVVVKNNIGAIWASYTFKAQDIKAVEEGGNDDGVVGITIKATPFQFASSRGETTPPPGVTAVNLDYPSETADSVLAGLKAVQQRAACSK